MKIIVWECNICNARVECDNSPDGWQYFISMTISPDGDSRRETSRLMVCENCQDITNEIINHKRRVRRIKNEVSTLPEGPEGPGDIYESVADGEASSGVSDE